MGKDKLKSAAKAAKEEPVPEVKPAKKAKGHRQRGAGTIITAPPPITTNDGITLAPHMRLPSTLLQEYCQREKRPKPIFQQCDSGGSAKAEASQYRFRVKLVDGKNSRNDLSFCPNQSSNSEKIAKDYAALLALFHFQPSIPLERKLPEPFCTSWKDLVASTQALNKSQQTRGNKMRVSSGSSPPASVAAPTSGKAISSPGESTSASSTPLSTRVLAPSPDACSTSVMHTTISMSTTTPSGRCSSDAVPKPARKQRGDVSGKDGVPAEGTAGSVNALPPRPPVAPPKALVGLQSASQFTSKAEREAQVLQRKAHVAVDKSYAEALLQANLPVQLTMSPALREQISSVLSPHIPSSAVGGVLFSAKGVLYKINMCMRELGMTGTTAIDVFTGSNFYFSGIIKRRSELSDDQNLFKIAESLFDICASVEATLLRTDFDRPCAQQAIMLALERTIDVSMQKHSQSNSYQYQHAVVGTQVRSILPGILEDAAIEYLCLTIDERLLPQIVGVHKFDRRNRVDVLAPSTSVHKRKDDPPFTQKSSTSATTSTSSMLEAEICDKLHRDEEGGSSARTWSPASACLDDSFGTDNNMVRAYLSEVYALMGYGWPLYICALAVCVVHVKLSGMSGPVSDGGDIERVPPECMHFTALALLCRATAQSVQSTSDGRDYVNSEYCGVIARFCDQCGLGGSSADSVSHGGVAGSGERPVNQEVWTEEVESLEAIFDSQFEVRNISINSAGTDAKGPGDDEYNGVGFKWLEGGTVARLTLTDRCAPLPSCILHWLTADKEDDINGISMQVLLAPASKYPRDPPLVCVHAAGLQGPIVASRGVPIGHVHSDSAVSSVERNTCRLHPSGCAHLVALQVLVAQESIRLSAQSGGDGGIVFQLSAFVEETVRNWSPHDSNKVSALDGSTLTARDISFSAICQQVVFLAQQMIRHDIRECLGFSVGVLSSAVQETHVGLNDDKVTNQFSCRAEDPKYAGDNGGNRTGEKVLHEGLLGRDPEQGMHSIDNAVAACSSLEDRVDTTSVSIASTAAIPNSDPTSATDSGDRNRRRPPSSSSNGRGGKKSRLFHPFWSRSQLPPGQVPPFTPTVSIANSPRGGQVTPSALLSVRERLPAWSMRNEFLQLCADNLAFIVTGETGCGKTTQIPQFLLEQSPQLKVCVCQPRRLAAVGVATRVAAEQNCEIGQRVGYSVRGNSRLSTDTQLLFCTYGILLRRLQSDPWLHGLDYVILDEVHERGVESDFVLSILLKIVRARALCSASPHPTSTSQSHFHGRPTGTTELRIILMSATIQTDKFASYLATALPTAHLSVMHTKKQKHVSSPVAAGSVNGVVPVMHIPGYTYPVAEFYLNDFKQAVHSGGFADMMSSAPTLRATDSSGKRSSCWGSDDEASEDDAAENEDDGEDEAGMDAAVNTHPVPSATQLTNPSINVGNSRVWGGNRSQRSKKKTWRGDVDYSTICKLILRLRGFRDTTAAGFGGSRKDAGDMLAPAQGAILVFLPGVAEIGRLIMMLRRHTTNGENGPAMASMTSAHAPMMILPLHGGLSNDEQKRVFDRPPRGTLKVVVATNVAEASITIDDVSVIIDSCLVKEMTMNHSNKMSSLVCVTASKDSMRQRRGRAGRVSEGRCFRLMTRDDYEEITAQSSTPEMLRVPVQRLVLQLQTMDMGGVLASGDCSGQATAYPVLETCLDPPSSDAIASAEALLMTIGALESHSRSVTPLGRHLAALPCDPPIGKMLLYGSLLQCVAPVTTIAASIICRDPFLMSLHDSDVRQRVDAAKRRFSSCIGPGWTRSDHLIVAQAMQEYREVGRSERARRTFCHTHGLSFDRMHEISTTQEELLTALIDLGFVQASLREVLDASNGFRRATPCTENASATNGRVVLAAVCAGLYPSICELIRPPRKFQDTMGGALEKEVAAEEIRFFIPDSIMTGKNAPASNTATSKTTYPAEVTMLADTSPHDGGDENEVVSAADVGLLLNEVYGRTFIKRRGRCSMAAELQLTGHRIQTCIHPASALSGETGFVSRYLLYNEVSLAPPRVVQDGAISKTFLRCMLRGVSEVSGYALMFFGGELHAQYTQGMVTVDGWIRFAVPGRVVALVKLLRQCVSDILARKIVDPSFDLHADPVITVLMLLLSTDGGST